MYIICKHNVCNMYTLCFSKNYCLWLKTSIYFSIDDSQPQFQESSTVCTKHVETMYTVYVHYSKVTHIKQFLDCFCYEMPVQVWLKARSPIAIRSTVAPSFCVLSTAAFFSAAIHFENVSFVMLVSQP